MVDATAKTLAEEVNRVRATAHDRFEQSAGSRPWPLEERTRRETLPADDASPTLDDAAGAGASAGAGGSIAMLGGWANFNTEGGVAELVLGLRARLDALLQVLLN